MYCIFTGADTREAEREPMANMNTNIDTDDSASRNTEISTLPDCP